MRQYIVRHEVAHAKAHRLSPNDQLSSSEIIEFTMTLQPIIQDKLLKRIDGDRLPRSLREAYHQALDLERKNQIMKRYETTVSQISDCTLEEARKKLYERRLKLRKALPIMLREISQLEEENQDQIELYIKQKSEFRVGIHMLVDQIECFEKR